MQDAFQPPRSTLEAARVPDGCHLRRHQLGRDQLLVSDARAASKGLAPVPSLREWTAPASRPTTRRWPPPLRRTNQQVAHLHTHILPRRDDIGDRLQLTPARVMLRWHLEASTRLRSTGLRPQRRRAPHHDPNNDGFWCDS